MTLKALVSGGIVVLGGFNSVLFHFRFGQSFGSLVAALHVSHKHFLLFGDPFVDALAGSFGLLFAFGFTIFLLYLMSFAFGLFQASTIGGIGDPDLGSIYDFPLFRASINIIFITFFNSFILDFFITPTNLAKEREK